MSELNAPVDKIDPNVRVPAAVRAAAARSEELFKAQQNAQASGDQQSQEAPETPPTPEAPPAELNKEAFTSETPQVKEKPNNVTKAPVTNADENWEHRYNSMKGRFEREQTETRRLAGEISNLHRLLSEMQASGAGAQSSADTQFERLVTPEEENDYGKEFLNVMGKKAKEELTPEIAQLKAHISQLESRLQGVTGAVVQDAREKMYSTLDNSVPTWRDINSNPEFLSWLNLPDAYSGAIRKELLNAAFNRNDANRVAAFFKGFISDEAATNPAFAGAGSEVTYAGNAQEAPKKTPLEAFAAPGRAKTAAANAPAEKPFFTREQISQFYSAKSRGAYRGREEEMNRIEGQIFAAQREGRIRK
jgi:hypothetical protein